MGSNNEANKRRGLKKIRAYFPKSRGKPRVYDRRVISGIVYVLRNDLKWRDVPKGYGLKTLYNHFVKWSKKGVFAKILQTLSKERTEILMVDATHLKVYGTAASLKKGGFHCGTLGSRKADSAESYAVCNAFWRPVRLVDGRQC
jgi:transposase